MSIRLTHSEHGREALALAAAPRDVDFISEMVEILKCHYRIQQTIEM